MLVAKKIVGLLLVAALSSSDLIAKQVKKSPRPVAVRQKKDSKPPRGAAKLVASADQARKEKAHKKELNAEQDIFKWFQTYSEVVSLVESKAFRPVDFSKFVQDSLRLAVSGIDAHCAFYTCDSYKEALESTSGEFSGIGVSIISKTPEDEALAIIDVIPQGPADVAGMHAGDKVIEVNNEKVRGLSTDEVVAKFKGKVGTIVEVKLIRDKKPLSFKVKRDIIKDQTSQCYYFAEQEVYFLSLKMFNEVSAEQISKLLVKANEGKCRGIVLDLRRNPGGTLDSAIEMAALFLSKGSLVTLTRDKKHQLVAEYKTNSDPLLKSDLPIFVLIDNFTASAAEILAGSLKYHSEQEHPGRSLMVFLLGTTTFGKGSVQELIPVKNGCALKLTTMLYYLPGDVSIQAEGIAPDFTVKPKMVPADEIKWINDLYGKETSLKHHITKDEVGGKKNPTASVDKKNEESPKEKTFLQRWFGAGETVDKPDAVSTAQVGLQKEAVEGEEPGSKKSFEEKQQESLAMDIQVQASINMIGLLDMAKKSNPEAVSSRKKAFEFLKSHYVTDDMPKIVKIQ